MRAADAYEQDYDAIVVGSGIGGLTAASLLAQLAGMRVLVLERHFALGGFTHTFSRPARRGRSGQAGQFRWEVGLHYVGDMASSTRSRRLFDLVTDGQVGWNALPDRFDRFHYPDFQIAVPSDPEQYCDELVEQFPAERDGIRSWFQDLERAGRWAIRAVASGMAPGPAARLIRAPGRHLATRTVADVLARHIRDPRLRALLTSQWGDYGMPPSRAPFALHALIATHYQHGAWFPAHGSEQIADAARAVIETAGGTCLLRHEVTELILDARRRVCGVRVSTRTGEIEMRAPRVISAAGAAITYGRLLPDLGLAQQAMLRRLPTPPTAVSLYLGLNGDTRSLAAIDRANHWVYRGYDHDTAFDLRHELLDGRPHAAFVSFGSLRTSNIRPPTAEIISFTDHGAFTAWGDQPWRRRGTDYQDLKDRIADGLLEFTDAALPGLADLVDYRELATPLTVESLTGHPQGAIYGAPATPRTLQAGAFGPRTPLKGLWLAGADAASAGVIGALMGGVLAAASILGPTGFPRIQRAAANAPQHHDIAPQPSRLPAHASARPDPQ